MPLLMVHLAVAVQVHNLEGTSPSPDFLLGSIAPDAVHMRPDSGPDDKRRSHLREVGGSIDQRGRRLLAQYGSQRDSPMGFAEGYVVHILTDELWFGSVFDLLRKRHPPDLSVQEQWSLYYLEADQIDFDLYHEVSWQGEIWSKLSTAQPRDFASLLTAEEIRQWRDRALIWFKELKQEPMIEPVYLTGADVQAFIDQAAEETAKTLRAWRSRAGACDS